MTIKEIAGALGLVSLTPQIASDDADVEQGYASDLLSDVLANAPSGGVLVTLQVHLNVIAVASHANLRAVVFTCDRQPDDDVVSHAVEEGIALFVTHADTFSVVGRLYELGIKGTINPTVKTKGA